MQRSLESLKEHPEVFWCKVEIKSDDECWIWMAGIGHGSYGVFRVGNKIYKAHRLAAWLSDMIESPMAPPRTEQHIKGFVLHDCDNPKCCNPKHFHIGNASDNQRESHARGRRTEQYKNWSAKLMKYRRQKRMTELIIS